MVDVFWETFILVTRNHVKCVAYAQFRIYHHNVSRASQYLRCASSITLVKRNFANPRNNIFAAQFHDATYSFPICEYIVDLYICDARETLWW